MARIIVGSLVIMAGWSAVTATYFAFRDDVLTRLLARQAQMQYAYEDRIADLRGQVDRLAVTGSAVLIADYKSDRTVPSSIGSIPPQYVEQLALYRAVLSLLYPNHLVRAALVWTAGPALTELPGKALDAAMSRPKHA